MTIILKGATLGMALALAGCLGSGELAPDAFVGQWDCGGTPVVLSERSVSVDGDTKRLAAINTSGNADFGLTTVRGERYSIFNTRKRSLTLYSYANQETLECSRTA